MMNKNFLIVIVRRSYLELEIILPILQLLKKNFSIHFFFLNEKSFNSLKQQKDIFNNFNRVYRTFYILKKYDLLYQWIQ